MIIHLEEECDYVNETALKNVIRKETRAYKMFKTKLGFNLNAKEQNQLSEF